MLARLVPQRIARAVCGWRGHRQRKYSAQQILTDEQGVKRAVIVQVETCRCGDAQGASTYGGQFPVLR